MTPGPIETYQAKSDGFYSLKDGHKIGTNPGSTPGADGAFGDPGTNNLYYGSTIGPGVTLSARETFYTKPLGIYHSYMNTGDGSSAFITQATNDLAAGRIPLISCKFPGLTWRQVSTGSADTFLNATFNGWAALNKGPIMFAPHSEPNGDEGTDGPTVADYIAMCDHIMGLTSKSTHPRILLVPILAGGPSNVSTGLQFADWMTATSCDLFGFNTYNHRSYSPNNYPPWKDQPVTACLDRQIAQMAAIDPDKKWIIGEWGVRTDPARAAYASGWMLDFYNKARSSGCYGMCFFDSNANVNDAGSPWTLNDTTDGTNGLERYNRQKATMLLSTSKYIPAGGLT